MFKIILGLLHLIFFEMEDAFVFSPEAVAHILNPSLVCKVQRQPGLSDKETVNDRSFILSSR